MALKDYDINDDYKPMGGGWRYIQSMPDGSHFRIPTHGTAAWGGDLVEMVKQFRINNAIPVGNVEKDVADYIRQVSPYNDKYNGKKSILGTRPDFKALIYRIREWLDKLAPQKPELVTVQEANERAAICIACGQNIKWKIDCSECNSAIEYLGRNTRALANYPLDEALQGCRTHGAHLPTLVFLDRGFLPDKIANQPPHCWVPDQAEHVHESNKPLTNQTT